jgi:NADPH oxidase 1
MLLIMVLMYATAHHKIRNQCFEAFWYTHHLAFFFFIGLYTHATGCFVRDSTNPDYISTFPFYSTEHCLGYESWRFTIWPGIAYFAERMYREYRARRATRLSKVLVHPSGAMELRIIKPSFKYTAGQWLFIQVPEVSRWQWHPVRNEQFVFYVVLTAEKNSLPSLLLLKIPMYPFTFVKLVIGPML